MWYEKASGKVTEDRVSSLLRHSGLPTPHSAGSTDGTDNTWGAQQEAGCQESGLGDRREARDLWTQRHWGWWVESLRGGCFQPLRGWLQGSWDRAGTGTQWGWQKRPLCVPPTCRHFVSWSGTNLPWCKVQSFELVVLPSESSFLFLKG